MKFFKLKVRINNLFYELDKCSKVVIEYFIDLCICKLFIY